MSREETNRYIQDQNPLGAFIGGIIGVLLSTAVWATVVSVYKLEIDIMAISVGFIVGYMVKIIGRGVTPLYGTIGVIFTFLGCISGRIVSAIIVSNAVPLTSVFSKIIELDNGTAVYYLESTFKSSDLIFYLIALIAGYYCSFRK